MFELLVCGMLIVLLCLFTVFTWLVLIVVFLYYFLMLMVFTIRLCWFSLFRFGIVVWSVVLIVGL